MLRSLIATTLVLFAVPFSVAQKTSSVSSERAAADVAWPVFFKTFRDAVRRRDEGAMKKMMVKDFFFSGGSDENNDGDFRDEAFKFLRDPQIHAWQAFDKVLTAGAVPTSPNPNAGGKKYLTRVAPPAARKVRNLENAPPWVATFEFRDGKWYCTSFSECCD